MGKYINISASDTKTRKQLLLDMISSIGKNFTLYYPGIMEDCENCIYDPIGNKSSNRFRTGGPIPFGVGQPCPYCNGAGKRTKEVTETLKFLSNWNLTDNFSNDKYITIGNIRIPAGGMLIRGEIKYLPSVQKCDYLVMENYNRFRFKVGSEPFDPGNIVPNEFFAAVLVRV